ncbi:hypothetical protein J5N97_003098 [Dioscorea zingiberensis]|uniref:Alpha/beta hydrolase fold-3 domain-containing protein n=1 Tax=Dioscorea zingiberensis TaxID=325984 RepID=A0A9D5D5C6_9LILI|nr:hypothetical protein J5N97_003098 [Dioscorea zingiberensis]
MANPDTEIVLDFYPRYRTYKSGRVERFIGTETVPAGVDSSTGVSSKDVVLLPDSGVSARLYLPPLLQPQPQTHLLPVLVYFHGGGFCIESAFSPTYHSYLNSLAANARVLIVSVNYRRAPEHLLPTAYNDSWEALRWVASRSEEWLGSYGDSSRVFVAGDSAGANIVHQLALRAGRETVGDGVELRGALLVHPYFWGSSPVGEETRDTVARSRIEWLWRMAAQPEMGLDHPYFNPVAEGAPILAGLACARVLVCVASEDTFGERGRHYYKQLVGSGWGGAVELLEAEGEGHVFHLKKPSCAKALEMMNVVVAFLNS